MGGGAWRAVGDQSRRRIYNKQRRDQIPPRFSAKRALRANTDRTLLSLPWTELKEGE